MDSIIDDVSVVLVEPGATYGNSDFVLSGELESLNYILFIDCVYNNSGLGVISSQIIIKYFIVRRSSYSKFTI